MKNNEELEFNKKKQEIEKQAHIYALKTFMIIVGTSILFNLVLREFRGRKKKDKIKIEELINKEEYKKNNIDSISTKNFKIP